MSFEKCIHCDKEYYYGDWEHEAEHIRKCPGCTSIVKISRPGPPGEPDSHGNTWYCFSCTGRDGYGDHRSYRCVCDLLTHLYQKHGIVTHMQSKKMREEKEEQERRLEEIQ